MSSPTYEEYPIPAPIPQPPSPPPPTNNQITLNLTALRALMWGFRDYESVELISWHRADSYAPKVAPSEFAEIIRHLDPVETVFHIERFDDHCEVWHSEHWQVSTSRRYKILRESDARQMERAKTEAERVTESLQSDIFTELTRLMPNLPPPTIRSMAQAFCRAPDSFWESIGAEGMPTVKRIVERHRRRAPAVTA